MAIAAPVPFGEPLGEPKATVVEAKVVTLDVEMVKAATRQIVGNVVGDDGDITDDHAFMEIGLDSLSALELRNNLAKNFAVTLSSSAVFDYPTISTLSEHIVQSSEKQARKALAKQ